jgi:hypothetical protein
MNGTKVLRCSSYFETIPETITRNSPNVDDLQVIDSSTEIAERGYEGESTDATMIAMVMSMMMMMSMMRMMMLICIHDC